MDKRPVQDQIGFPIPVHFSCFTSAWGLPYFLRTEILTWVRNLVIFTPDCYKNEKNPFVPPSVSVCWSCCLGSGERANPNKKAKPGLAGKSVPAGASTAVGDDQSIFADTMVVYHPSALPHNLSSNQDKQLRTDCRPVYLYRKSSGKSFPLGANPGKDLVNALDALLTPRHISEVIILIDQKETALYGSRGNCGVVKLTFKDSRAFEELQDLTSK